MRPILSFIIVLTTVLTSCSREQEPKVQDKYRWLENENLPATREWLAEQKAHTNAYFNDAKLREVLLERVAPMMTDTAEIGLPNKVGEDYFFLGRPQSESKPSIYKKDPSGQMTRLVDGEALEKKATITGYRIKGIRNLMAYGLSMSGSDWEEWHIRDLKTGKELPDIVKGIKFSNPVWNADGQGLYYFLASQEGDTDTGKLNHQELRYHRLGNADDQKLYTIANKMLATDLNISSDGRYLLFVEKEGALANNAVTYVDLKKDPQHFLELLPLGDFYYHYVGDYEGRLFFHTNKDAEKGQIVSIDPAHPEEGLKTHVAEREFFLENAILTKDKIVATYVKDVNSHVHLFTYEGQLDRSLPIPPLSAIGLGEESENAQETTEFFYRSTEFTRPPSVYRVDANTGTNELFFASKVVWNPEDYEVHQVFYPSKDGTKIPMSLIYKKGLKLDGDNPLVLSGYGGFGIPIVPALNLCMLTWMDLGGVYAVANIRGGGEYGEAWHKAGMLSNKQNVFDDFIAATKWLDANGYTRPGKTAIYGKSNGGLLVAATALQRPDLFKAAFVDVGVLDMLRFHLFTVGWLWTKEYGSPDSPEDFKYLHAYSPYHQAKPGVAYPAMLIATADHDDRVVPMHSYKFTAVMQEAQGGPSPIMLRVYENMGHGVGAGTQEKMLRIVDQLTFYMKELQVDSSRL
jgi:prolyl oligopeptidase